ncbi:hypothetical protein FQN57_000059 [Myotisia sp. PD_48]|nr:hypothetical protein FQN57_000059 [Myotisia sp. PD_48]
MASLHSPHSTSSRLRRSTTQESQSEDSSQGTIDPGDESCEELETVFSNTRSSTPKRDSSEQKSEPTPRIALPTTMDGTGVEEDEPRKCWICYTDETEDSPLNKEWRSPCPCALNAHEACLLDWLADMENPKTRKDNGREAKMLCPQCKSEIVISRPRSFVVDFVRKVQELLGRLVLPGMVFTLAGTVWAGCCAHGVYTMYLIFGQEDARKLLDGAADGSWSPKLNVGLPFIPLALIFSRTRYAEGLLPAIPVLFFTTHHPYAYELDMDMWPPTAAMTFAALPYAKSFYKLVYEKTFGKLERNWIAEVQPRAGEDDAQQGNGAQGGQEVPNNDLHHEHNHIPENEGGEIVMEIELQVGIGGDELHDNLPHQQGQHDAQGQANHILGRRQDDIIHETSNISDTVLGALLFPAISAGMGGILKMALPKAWTIAPTSEKTRAGLLQSRWGRSVIGGCVFVLLKDAIILYCRWKLAQSHRQRKVLNYDRVKKRSVE